MQVKVRWAPLRFLQIIIALHFVGSNITFHLSAQMFILSRSRFRLAVTESFLPADHIGAYRVESTAYKFSSFSQTSTRSSMKTENRRGPSMKLCRTDAGDGQRVRGLSRGNNFNGSSIKVTSQLDEHLLYIPLDLLARRPLCHTL